MSKLQWTGALAAVAATLTLAGGDAEADHRGRYNFSPFYFAPGPQWGPPPRYYYYYDDPAPYRYYRYDEGYYEPRYDDPAPQKPRKKRKTTATSSDAKKKKKTTVATAEQKPKSSGAMTCAKATAIVSGYGFASVKAEDCQGQVYAFNARRDGKAYAIKLSAASGELTEVKKLP